MKRLVLASVVCGLLVGAALTAVAGDDDKGPVNLLGKVKVEVPKVTSMMGADGIAALQKVGLKGEYSSETRAISDAEVAGRIFAQLPAAGTKVAYGSKVTLTLWKLVTRNNTDDPKGRVTIPGINVTPTR